VALVPSHVCTFRHTLHSVPPLTSTHTHNDMTRNDTTRHTLRQVNALVEKPCSALVRGSTDIFFTNVLTRRPLIETREGFGRSRVHQVTRLHLWTIRLGWLFGKARQHGPQLAPPLVCLAPPFCFSRCSTVVLDFKCVWRWCGCAGEFDKNHPVSSTTSGGQGADSVDGGPMAETRRGSGKPVAVSNAWSGNAAAANSAAEIGSAAAAADGAEWPRGKHSVTDDACRAVPSPMAWSERAPPPSAARTMSTSAPPFQPRSRGKDQKKKKGGRRYVPACLDLGKGNGDAVGSEDQQDMYGDSTVSYGSYRPYPMPLAPTSPFLIAGAPAQFGFPTHAFGAGRQYGIPAMVGGEQIFMGEAAGYPPERSKYGRGYNWRPRGGGHRQCHGKQAAYGSNSASSEYYQFASLGSESKSRRKGRGAGASRRSRNVRPVRTTTRSKLLEDFHSGGGVSTLSLSELAGYILEFAADQHGSRLVSLHDCFSARR
jgi:hypothetical protein